MEIAGLVLGAVGLLGPSAHLFANCRRLIQESRKVFINRELQKLDKKLQKNRLLFERECKILLKRVVSDEGVNAMLSDNTHVMWTEAGFKAKWDKVYGTHFDDHMEEVRKVMVDINMELVKICGLYAPTNGQSLITADVIAEPSKQSLKNRVSARIHWVHKGKDNLCDLSDNLTDGVEYIRVLREQAFALEQPAMTLVQEEPSLMLPPRKTLPSEVLNVREAATKLFEELAATANCPCHRVNLRLQIHQREIGEIQKGEPQNITRFRFIATTEAKALGNSIDLDDSFTHPICTCLTVNSSLDEPTDAKNLPSALGASSKKRSAKSMTEALKRVCFTDQRMNDISRIHCDISLDISNAPTIQDLCSILASITPTTSTKEMLGVIKRAKGSSSISSFRHTIYLDPPVYESTQRVSLGQILIRPDKQYFFPREKRLKTAYLLALSVLQFGSNSPTSWFSNRWRSKDIYYFLDLNNHQRNFEATLEPYVAPRFPCRPKAACKGKGKAIDISSKFQQHSIYLPNGASHTTQLPAWLTTQSQNSGGLVRNEQLFSLAVVLIEIAFGCPILQIYEPIGGIGQSSPQGHQQQALPGADMEADDFVEFLKAKRIVKWHMLAKEMGDTYAKVVRRCLFGELGGGAVHRKGGGGGPGADSRGMGGEQQGCGDPNLVVEAEIDLDRKDLQDLFWEEVVCELGKLQLS